MLSGAIASGGTGSKAGAHPPIRGRTRKIKTRRKVSSDVVIVAFYLTRVFAFRRYIAQGLKLDMNQYVEEKYEIVKETKREEEKRVEEIKEQERAQKAGLLPPTFPVRKGTTVEQATNAATQIQKVYRGHLGRLEAEMEGKLRRMEMQIRREEDRIREIYTKISDAKVNETFLSSLGYIFSPSGYCFSHYFFLFKKN